VLCQLLAAPLLAWFFEWRSSTKRLVRTQPQEAFRGRLAPTRDYQISNRWAVNLDSTQFGVSAGPAGLRSVRQMKR